MHETEFQITQKEAADLLQVSTKSITRYRKRGLPHRLVLNPGTGKQEVRFRRADLERWEEGRQLLATHGREGAQPVTTETGRGEQGHLDQGFLQELLAAYREQIEILREQLEDMRAQLARRDRHIDELMRLMVGLQLEYQPLTEGQESQPEIPGDDGARTAACVEADDGPDVYEPPVVIELGASPPPQADAGPREKKRFGRQQLAASIRQLRVKGKTWEEIVLALNHINAATISGQPEWTVDEVMALLPPLLSPESGQGYRLS